MIRRATATRAATRPIPSRWRSSRPRLAAFAAPVFAHAIAAIAFTCAILAVAGVAHGAAPGARHAQDPPAETVVLLHGLGRSHLSMWPLEQFLEEHGYRVVNIDYPSTSYPIAELTELLGKELEECCADASGRVHFVTHSMGGILLRAYLAGHSVDSLGRVVMLSPPNQGSEVADQVRDWDVVEFFLGPAARELGTDSSSVPLSLPPVDFELGVITGSRSLNPVAAVWIDGPNDGAVAVDRARVEGLRDFLVVPRTHTFIMWSTEVMEQVLEFLRHGRFAR